MGFSKKFKKLSGKVFKPILKKFGLRRSLSGANSASSVSSAYGIYGKTGSIVGRF